MTSEKRIRKFQWIIISYTLSSVVVASTQVNNGIIALNFFVGFVLFLRYLYLIYTTGITIPFNNSRVISKQENPVEFMMEVVVGLLFSLVCLLGSFYFLLRL